MPLRNQPPRSIQTPTDLPGDASRWRPSTQGSGRTRRVWVWERRVVGRPMASRTRSSDKRQRDPPRRDLHEIPVGLSRQRTPSHHRSPNRCRGASASATALGLRFDRLPAFDTRLPDRGMLGGNRKGWRAREPDVRDAGDGIGLVPHVHGYTIKETLSADSERWRRSVGERDVVIGHSCSPRTNISRLKATSAAAATTPRPFRRTTNAPRHLTLANRTWVSRPSVLASGVWDGHRLASCPGSDPVPARTSTPSAPSAGRRSRTGTPGSSPVQRGSTSAKGVSICAPRSWKRSATLRRDGRAWARDAGDATRTYVGPPPVSDTRGDSSTA
jgi:hypothetical protein